MSERLFELFEYSKEKCKKKLVLNMKKIHVLVDNTIQEAKSEFIQQAYINFRYSSKI